MSEVKLTVQQQAAVENRGGSLLVSAAAGSGKTKVLVERLFAYVIEDRRNLDDFLIITYTKAAAAELRGKIAAELSVRVADNPSDLHLRRQLLRVYQADIKTVDAFCTALLRQNTHLLPREEDRHALTPDFRVLDEKEAQILRQQVLERVLERFYEELDPAREQLADTLGAGRDDRKLAQLVLEVYGKLQSHADPEAWLERSRRTWEAWPASFDETPYAAQLLSGLAQKALHWGRTLEHWAAQTEMDPALMAGYGVKFLSAARGFLDLAACGTWEEARVGIGRISFDRLTTPRGRKDEPQVAAMRQVWDACKDEKKKMETLLCVSGEEALEDLRAVSPGMEALIALTQDFAQAYRAEKLRLNAADFSDQEHLALQILQQQDGTPTDLARQIAQRYTEILVDEYQDTNEVQNAIFKAISRDGENLFTVGDVKQSIYRFRLADPSIFLEKYSRFAPYEKAQPGQERKILLSRNFRSRQEILEAVNFVFSNILSRQMGEMEYGEDEALYFGAAYYPPREDCDVEFHLLAARETGEEGEEASVKRVEAEAVFVAQRIRDLLDQEYPVTGEDGALRPCRPEDIVILMRSPGSRISTFAAALWQKGIPCSFEQSEDFFQTMEVSVAISLLKIIDNPRQDVALISVLRSPVFGFSPDRLAQIRAAAPKGDFYEAVVAEGGEDCQLFLEMLGSLRQAARDMSVHRLIWHVYNQLNLLGIFGAMDQGVERRENLITFGRYAENFERGGHRGLFAFVTQLQRMIDAGETPEIQSAAAANGVQIMSIHKSKGLEFPIVFLADLDRGFSRQDFESPVLVHPQMGLGPQRVDLERKIKYPTLARRAIEEKLRRENLAEEQRILYVAMTRPKEKLILVDAMYRPESRLQKIAAQAACPVPPEAVAAGKNFGEWLLLTLLCRPEARCLRQAAGAGEEMLIPIHGERPWSVFFHPYAKGLARQRAPGAELRPVPEEGTGPAEAGFSPELLEYRYPYQRETLLPAKVTATQLKGRLIDEEIAEGTARTPYLRPLSQPKFRRSGQGLTPAERGTAAHLVLQYLDFSDRDAAGQIQNMLAQNKLTDLQAQAVDVSALERFLSSPLAEEIRGAEHVLREYRFTLLVDARSCDAEAPEGEQILLQGVADCCFETCQGLNIVDFKTDHVFTQEEVLRRAEHYRPQIEAYSMALERVLEKPVHRKILYFLAPGRTVEL